MFWHSWKSQNSYIFSLQAFSVESTTRAALLDFNFILSSVITEGKSTKYVPHVLTWSKPRHGTLKINVDGSWVQNQDSGGVGFLVRDSNGSCLLAASIYVLEESSLEAEILAIKAALQHIYN